MGLFCRNGVRDLFGRVRSVVERFVRPHRKEDRNPFRHREIVLEPSGKVTIARARAGKSKARRAADRPSAHHLIRDFGVKLQSDDIAPVNISLIWKISETVGKTMRSGRKIEPFAMPMIDMPGEFRRAYRGAKTRRTQGIVTDLASAVFEGINRRSQLPGHQLRAETKPQKRNVRLEYGSQPIYFSPDPFVTVISRHRTSEYDYAGVLVHGSWQFAAQSRNYNLKPKTEAL